MKKTIIKINWFKNKYINSILIAFFLNFIIEAFSRHSIIEALRYLVQSPLIFIYNTLLILTTFLPILLIRRQFAFFILISFIWLVGGITNGIVLSNRVTPFTANELRLITSIIDMLPKYFNNFQIIILASASIMALIGLIIIFFKAPKLKTVDYKKNISIVATGFICFLLVTQYAISTELVKTTFGNIAFAYLDYGFPYCFTNSLVNKGIRQPINYSETNMMALQNHINSSAKSNELNISKPIADANSTHPYPKHPNIIFVQLESFFDPTHLTDLSFSEDPIPNFRYLKENYSSGYLQVPSIGAGTANTEFEVLTGMSLQFFGAGEYPYKTILRQTTAESVNYNLAEIGFTSHAIHNNRGTFYTRQNVFKALGFNTFTSIEYMDIKETTPMGWAKDIYLIDPIFDALNYTEGPHFIFTISVQGHGDYPSTPIPGHSLITVSGWEDQDRLTSFEYFTNEIHDMDHFIGELVDRLSQYNEDVVLVLYGDHLPTLGINDAELSNGNIFQTEYIIWDNFNLPRKSADLYAYQLVAHVLDQLKIHTGTLTNFHQNFQDSPDYLNNLRLLQYDMLYGNQYIYGGKNPFERTQLQMGVKPISISLAFNDTHGDLYILGENFTPNSRVTINSNTYSTDYIDSNTLMVEDYLLSQGDILAIQQVTSTNFVLSTSENFEVTLESQEGLIENPTPLKK